MRRWSQILFHSYCYRDSGGFQVVFKLFYRFFRGALECAVRLVVGDEVDLGVRFRGKSGETHRLFREIIDSGKHDVFKSKQPSGRLTVKLACGDDILDIAAVLAWNQEGTHLVIRRVKRNGEIPLPAVFRQIADARRPAAG